MKRCSLIARVRTKATANRIADRWRTNGFRVRVKRGAGALKYRVMNCGPKNTATRRSQTDLINDRLRWLDNQR